MIGCNPYFCTVGKHTGIQSKSAIIVKPLKRLVNACWIGKTRDYVQILPHIFSSLGKIVCAICGEQKMTLVHEVNDKIFAFFLDPDVITRAPEPRSLSIMVFG